MQFNKILADARRKTFAVCVGLDVDPDKFSAAQDSDSPTGS
jgi:hypothetical protein